jgi:serine/threonine protein kinase/dipeptidyl aminopeptidase/acylaminoacyl peptidase
MTLNAGTRLGPYEIVGAIGAGGMGEVYRARDSKLDRLVAIKVLPSQLAENATALARFEREAKAVAALSHPNILSIFDFGHEGTTVFAVMELLDGETLRQKLAAPIPIRKSVEYGVQIARGLAAAHAKGIVHRDLKPENVFVTADGRVKILDFGLARQTLAFGGADATASPTIERHTDPGTVLGTVGYMSPEQARGEPGDQRSDIFSLGALLYELVSGRRAFQRDTAAETLTAILREEPPDLSPSSSWAVPPPGLARVIQHCLEKSPAERFQSASDAAFALEALSSASGTSTSEAQAARAPSPRRGRRGLVAAAILTGAALITTAVVVAVRTIAPPSRDISFTPLTYRQQAILRALFTPDGKTIVFSTVFSGTEPEIFTLAANSAEPRSLGVKDVQLLSVSSKSELAVLTGAKYLGHRLYDGTLARMPIGGSAPREIAEHVREADWGPDGERLAIIRDVDGRDRLEFPMGTVLYEAPGYLSDLRVSPAGDRVAFFEHPVKYDDRGDVAVVDLARRKTTLGNGYWGLEGLAWSRDGSELLFAAGLSYAQFRIYGVTLGGRIRQALESAGGLTIHDIALDGRWLVTRDDIGATMMVKPAGARQEVDLSWLDFTSPVRFTGDGRTLLFSEQSGPVGTNYATGLRRTDGSPLVQLGEGLGTDLSPDGKWVLSIVPSSPPTLMLYPTGAGEARRLDTRPIESLSTAKWFPDGRHFLFCGAEPGHASRCYVHDLNGPPRAVTADNVGNGLVAPDGRHFLARRGGANSRVQASTNSKPEMYSIDGGEPRPVPGLTADDVLVRFAPDGRSVIVTQNTLSARVERVFLDTGRRELMYEIAPSRTAGIVGISSLTVAEDPAMYAYSLYQFLSRLFIVQGAR